MTQREFEDSFNNWFITTMRVGQEISARCVEFIYALTGRYHEGYTPPIQNSTTTRPKDFVGSLNINFYYNYYRPVVLGGRDYITIDIAKSNKVLQYSDTVRTVSDRYGIPANVILALIHQESSGVADIAAKGSSARGLGQFTVATARNLGLRVDSSTDERIDPDKAIDAIGRHLGDLTGKFDGDISKALMAYHEGEGGARRISELADRGASQSEIMSSLASNSVSGQKELLTYMSNILALAGEYK